MKLTHLDKNGSAIMVDVGDKEITNREAVAQALITMQPETLSLILNSELKKGDVLATARIAGIMAAKHTSDLIPLCHPIALTKVQVDFHSLSPDKILITSLVRCKQPTGVEMEALTAVSTAALTIYDMCKAVDRGIRIDEIYLLKKSGGQSGLYIRETKNDNIAESIIFDSNKTATLKELYLKIHKGQGKLALIECILDENGMEGYTEGDKAISLLDNNAYIEIVKENYRGLCMKRFYGNLVTQDLDYKTLNQGDILNIGEASIEITQVGKSCFEGCELVEQKIRCPLKQNCAFAKVLQPGKIQRGNKLEKQ